MLASVESELGGTPTADDPGIPLKHLRVRYFDNGVTLAKVAFDTGQSLPFEADKGTLALVEKAAVAYAMLNTSWKVTPGQLIESGLWPYYNLPSDQLDRPIAGGVLEMPLSSYRSLTQDVGSHRWLLTVRAQILEGFNVRHYRQNPLPPLPEEVGLFWTNPITGQPMSESYEQGDYRLVPAGEYRKQRPFSRPAFSEPEPIEDIGYARRINFVKFVNPEARQVSSSLAGGNEVCCLFERWGGDPDPPIQSPPAMSGIILLLVLVGPGLVTLALSFGDSHFVRAVKYTIPVQDTLAVQPWLAHIKLSLIAVNSDRILSFIVGGVRHKHQQFARHHQVAISNIQIAGIGGRQSTMR